MSTLLIMWTINLVLMLCCLIKMLVYGDPVMKPKTPEFVNYWKHKKQSDLEFERGNSNASYNELTRCLHFFGLSLPSSRIDCFTSTWWQMTRMFLHRLWIGRFLSKKSGGLFKVNANRLDALTSAKELSLVYHRLNQLHLTSSLQDSNGIMLSLYSVIKNNFYIDQQIKLKLVLMLRLTWLKQQMI